MGEGNVTHPDNGDWVNGALGGDGNFTSSQATKKSQGHAYPDHLRIKVWQEQGKHVGHNMKGNGGFLGGWWSIVIDTLDCQFNSGGGQGIRPKAIQHVQGFEGRQINLEGSTCYVRRQKSNVTQYNLLRGWQGLHLKLLAKFKKGPLY